jgi:hypothetical protein
MIRYSVLYTIVYVFVTHILQIKRKIILGPVKKVMFVSFYL